MAKTQSAKEPELHEDAWARFERAKCGTLPEPGFLEVKVRLNGRAFAPTGASQNGPRLSTQFSTGKSR
jgi:hypothetical protein